MQFISKFQRISPPLRKAISILCCLLFAVLCLIPLNIGGQWDKLFHFGFFGFAAVLAYRLASSNRVYFLVCTIIVTFSALVELLQAFVPGRAMSGLDLLANIAGVFLAALLMYWLYGSKNQEA